MEYVSLVARWLHILAGMTAVGGSIFARFVVLPTLEPLPPAERTELHAQMRKRWSKLVQISIGFLLLSGLYNIGMIEAKTTAGAVYAWYRPLFGIKFILAMVMFVLASLLTGRTAAADKLRQNARFWMNVNILLAVAVVCISGVLRTAEKTPKKPASETPAATVSESK